VIGKLGQTDNNKERNNMESIKEILMTRDDMTAEEADDLIAQAQDDFNAGYHVDRGELAAAENICSVWFNLEPDYLIEFF
jgi:hypothetical protein